MVETGELQGPTGDLAMYRRSEVAHFVTWARATIIRLRDAAQKADARALAAERARVEAERSLQRRDHDMQAVLGKALLLVQSAAEQVEARANELVAKAHAEVDQARADAAAARLEAERHRNEMSLRVDAPVALRAPAANFERVQGLWETDDDADFVLAPLRSVRTNGS